MGLGRTSNMNPGWTWRIKMKVRHIWQQKCFLSVRKYKIVTCSKATADKLRVTENAFSLIEMNCLATKNAVLSPVCATSVPSVCSLPVKTGVPCCKSEEISGNETSLQFSSPPQPQGEVEVYSKPYHPHAGKTKYTCIPVRTSHMGRALVRHVNTSTRSDGQINLLSKGVHTPYFQQRRCVKSLKVETEDVVSVEEIKSLLGELEMKYEQGFTCFVTKCQRLVQSSKRAKLATDCDGLYINLTTGHFLCQHCSRRGGWQDLKDNLRLVASLPQRRRKDYECFKDLESVQMTDRGSQQAVKIWESAMPIKSCADDIFTLIQEHFDIHELQAKTLDTYGVRFDITSNSLILPAYSGTGHLIGVRRLTCTIPEENHNVRVLQSSLFPKSGVLGLFGLSTLTQDVKEIVLTCSELDAMAVYQETKAPTLALPLGISTLPPELLPSLERFSKLVLWFGDDVRAWEAAKLFAKKLNDKRCCIIRPSVEDPSPLEALRRGINLRSVLSKARPVRHKSIVSFAQLRQEVFSELSHAEQVAGVKWKRYTVLNRLLKGHRRGELTVFTGPTGSGKTTFISDYSLDLCMQGVNTLWGSFEINNVRLGKMMLTQFAQKNMSRHLEDFDEWADRFEELPMFFMTFFGQESIRNVIEAMSHAVYIHDIAHVIVDNLQFMMGTEGEWSDRFARQDSFITAFRRFATNMNCHVTLVIHPRKEKDSEDLTTASVFGSAKATQEADNVLILQDKRLSSVRGRKYLQVTKNRFDGELGVMLLKFDKESLSFAIKEKATKRHPTKDDHGSEDTVGDVPVTEDWEFPSEGF